MEREELYIIKTIKNEYGKLMNLFYYILKKEFNSSTKSKEWGIKVEIKEDGKISDMSSVEFVTPKKDEIINLVNIISEYDVTPVSLKEVLYDIISEK